MQKEVLESIFALGHAQLSPPLLKEKNPTGPARLAKLESIFTEGKSIQLQFPVEDLGFKGYQAILDGLDEEDFIEESGHVAEKKRQLSTEQVKALEKNFEVENKLEPEREVKLEASLGLQLLASIELACSLLPVWN
ncbi:hypothetical protein MRB53_010038 [Persea americana]|uniref:Uncharacterized protein n=1 Tax=Persea americana TaxID=3435 RepID=A0ACC2LQL3_PERAE|nr:hypothetical protein MRB53_010038 [Persea americana]